VEVHIAPAVVRWAELFIIYIAGAVARRVEVHIAPAVVSWTEQFIIYMAGAVERRRRST
jgi:hypothetical protein